MRFIAKKYSTLFALVVALIYVGLPAGCASSGTLSQPSAMPEIVPGFVAGYLPQNALPNSLALLPPPPVAGSAALAYDEEINGKTLTLRGTPRWMLANEDANLMFPAAAGTFSCALNTRITEQDTPRLYMLLRRTLTDAGLSTYAAKDHYKRTRPFGVNKEAICAADERKTYVEDGSYPSGHSAVGWAWALILTEISPGDTDAILARGRAFGDSRLVCNVHWQSDVTEGRFMGASAVARLHADQTFRADLKAAKSEFDAVRAKGLSPLRDCLAEAAALGK